MTLKQKLIRAGFDVEEVESMSIQGDKIIHKWIDNGGGDFGKSKDPVWTKDDTIYSYATIIGKMEGKKLYLNNTKYSQTTSKYQRELESYAKEQGYRILPYQENFFKTSMPYKFQGHGYY